MSTALGLGAEWAREACAGLTAGSVVHLRELPPLKQRSGIRDEWQLEEERRLDRHPSQCLRRVTWGQPQACWRENSGVERRDVVTGIPDWAGATTRCKFIDAGQRGDARGGQTVTGCVVTRPAAGHTLGGHCGGPQCVA